MITPAILAASKRGKTTVELWQERVSAAGGSFGANSVALASTLVAQLQAQTYYEKILWLLPLLGVGINAARVPLIDRLNKGAASNTGFVDEDFSEATGLQGNGTSKYLTTAIKPADLSITGSLGGMGWWELGPTNNSLYEPIGAASADGVVRCALDLRVNFCLYTFGSINYQKAVANYPAAASSSHFYGQKRSDSERKLFRAGAQIAIANASDTTSAPNVSIGAWCSFYGSTVCPYPGRGGVSYLTSGDLSDAEVAALHTLLQTYLLQPTGRVP